MCISLYCVWCDMMWVMMMMMDMKELYQYQVSKFMSRTDREAQLYPQVLDVHLLASYELYKRMVGPVTTRKVKSPSGVSWV